MSAQPPSRYHSSSRQRDSQASGRHSQQPARRSSGSRPRPDPSSAADNAPINSVPRTRRTSSARRESQINSGSHSAAPRPRRSSTHQLADIDTSRPRGRDQGPVASASQSKKPPTESYVQVRPLPSPPVERPGFPAQHQDREPMLESVAKGTDLNRKKSLVRPERRRRDPDEPGYHYQKHAQNMNVMPSTTGRDPLLEETVNSTGPVRRGERPTGDAQRRRPAPVQRNSSQKVPTKLVRTGTQRAQEEQAKEKRRKKIEEDAGALTIWSAYCHVITCFVPNFALALCGKPKKEQQRAWREKIGLISIIMLAMLFVGFLTFGFTATVCPEGGPTRMRINEVGNGYMIFHGSAYDLEGSQHPAALGVPYHTDVLYPPVNAGGMDGSFLFQSVNGACKGLITPAPGSDVPVNSNGDMAWYFPCQTFKQDGSTKAPNSTNPYYLGYACHTSSLSRQQFYDYPVKGDVYFTWEDARNQSRNLMVYAGDVLDLDLLTWFNKSEVAYPAKFDAIRTDSSLRGQDVTWLFSSGENKQVAECFQQIIKVGTIDTESIGCIASKVVLYVSLAFILSIVIIKFILACLFQWFLCRKYAPEKTSMSGDKKKRNQQIEEWTDDIYRAPPKITDPASHSGSSDYNNKRASFFPTTSRFTSPYTVDKSFGRQRPTTMASQHSGHRLMPSGNRQSLYGILNRSEGTLAYTDGTKQSIESRVSFVESQPSPTFKPGMNSIVHTENTGPSGFIHEAVVPQPPVEWQPFGYPLAHTICLVTAYSEGPEGIRTTLDSIAMTDYPNSHKLIYVICDGLIKGKGESMSTPDVCINMLRDHVIEPEDVQPYSYVAVASGSKRHNMAKVYCGFYDYGADSVIPVEKQQRVPMMVVVKCGTPAEASTSKPGNRGKRDSQIILMSFLQKVMFDERMTELEYEMFNGIWNITGISPDFYEITLMVDADTKVFPDSLTHMVSAMVKDPEIMGLCGETKIANKTQSWVSMIQVFEYFISHHQAKAFESVFGGVTCLPGCFCMYRIKSPKGGQNYWVPILANPDIVEHYSENVVDTLHKKNLLLLGEDRYLTSLMLRTFPKRKQVFIPQAVCKTTVPDEFKVLLSQRRRWINSTVHNLMELILVRDLCGTFCFSMQFVIFIDLVGTLVLPAAIAFTVYVVSRAIYAAVTHTVAPTVSLILLALILGLPGVLIVITAHSLTYVMWMLIYLVSLPIWNFVLPVYAFWHFDDFSWGDTRQAAGELKGADKAGHGGDGEFDSSKITMKRWGDFEQDRRMRGGTTTASSRPASRHQSMSSNAILTAPSNMYAGSRERRQSSHLI